MITRRTALILGLVLAAGILAAAPLRNYPLTLRQPNGDIIHCFASGDEFHNWLHDKDSYTIVQHPETGYYVYALKVNGEIIASSYIVGKADPKNVGLERGVNISPAQMTRKRENQFSRLTTPLGRAPQKGTINNVAMFIRFSDEPEYTDSISVYDKMFNRPAPASSMMSYYKEASYEKLSVTTTLYPVSSTTVISYQSPLPRAYYKPYQNITNRAGYKNDDQRIVREDSLLYNAVMAIRSSVPAGLNLDGDGDGNVDNVCFIVSGDPTAWSTLLWPHRWALYALNVAINGKRVYDFNFQLQNELKQGGASTLCHEMFHSLGAPDLYHYTDDGIDPVGQWDLMNINATPPEHMTAYMKYRYGKWIDSVQTISASGTYTINPLTSAANNCYKILSPFSASEYFMVEFRKKTGTFEQSVPGSGLLIYRINTAEDGAGNASGPPDELYIYRPNGTPSANGTINNANYSSGVGRTAINDLTDPSSFLQNGTKGGLSISNVGTAGGTISFTVTVAGIDSSTTVLTPNGGERWAIGSTQYITWSAPKLKTITLEYTTDNGTGWLPIVQNIPAAAKYYAWVIPNTPSLQCKVRLSDSAAVGTFDVSDSLFTIANGVVGDEWVVQSSGTGSDFYTVNTVDDHVAWIGGAGGTVLRTTNGGVTWSAVTSVAENVYNIKGVSASTALAATSSASETKIKKTTDGGQTWTDVYTQSGGFIDAIEMFDANNGYAVGDPVGANWTLLKTTDGGLSWSSAVTLAAPSGEAGWNNSMSWVGTTGYFGTNSSKVYKSTNGGASWTPISTVDVNSLAIKFVSANAGIVGSNSGIVNTTTNGGTNWSRVGTGGSSDILGLASISDADFWCSGGPLIWKTTSGGAQWTPIDLGAGDLNDLHIKGTSTSAYGYAVGPGGAVARFRNGLTVPYVKVISPNGGEQWTIGTTRQIIWNAGGVTSVKLEYSVNNGSTWTTIGYAPATAQPRSPANTSGAEFAPHAETLTSFGWVIPNTPTTQARVRVSDSSDASTFDLSDSQFSIKLATGPAMQFAFNISAVEPNSYGVEFDGTYFYTSKWSATNGKLYRWSKDGALVDTHAVTGMTTGFRDLAWDGTYLYGGSFGPAIYKVDVNTWNVVGTIPATGYQVRGIAYNKQSDAFWIASWNSNIVLINRSGTVIQTLPASAHKFSGMAGIAYDTFSSGGPYLWIFDGGDTSTTKRLYKINPATGARLDSIDALEDLPVFGAIGGGCFVTDQYQAGTITVGGLNQGTSFIFGWNLNAANGVAEGRIGVPLVYSLEQNFPNPFNPSTTIQFTLPAPQRVRLKVYDILGREVVTLVDGELGAGERKVTFDAKGLGSGLYFYSLDSPSGRMTKKMMLIK